MTDLHLSLLSMYMDSSKLKRTEIRDIEPAEGTYFVSLLNVYVGVELHNQLGILLKDTPKIIEFKHRCRDFYVSACVEIRKRYDFTNEITPKLTYLTPRIALGTSDTRPLSIQPLVCSLPRIVRSNEIEKIQRHDDQWRKLPVETFPKNFALPMWTVFG